jgi:hypothetical protein
MKILCEELVKFDSYRSHKTIKCPYENSPLKIYKDMSSRRKGAAFEQIFEEFMMKRGFTKKRNENSGHDRIFVDPNGKSQKYEIKGSMIWGEKTNGFFRWQQIRVDQDYDKIAFLALYPDRIEIFIADKKIVSEFVDVKDSKGFYPFNQHGGKHVRSGTFMIQGRPEDFPFMVKDCD